jgi:isopentenyl diphosphate isomerase/L-lactate dehydrogenase-like FMN-dependent dehydrogenase
MSSPRRVTRAVNIEDLRQLARRRLPRVVFDYIDGGADAERTLRENCRIFDDITFRPRAAVAVPQVDLGIRAIGQSFSLPFLLAPIGSSRMFFPRAETHAAAAAGAAGTGYILSTLSGCALEDVKRATQGPAWYQVYLVGGREVAERAIARAAEAGFSALVVTVDTAMSGMRERDLRNGTPALLSGNPLAMAPHAWQLVTRPRWLAGFLGDGGLMQFPNVVLPGSGPMKYESVGPALARSVVTWADLAWIRQVWRGPILVKGVLTGDDARRSADEGASGVIVSNHGGRQLDGVAASLRALPEVVDAAGARVDVLMDGGIRRGSDIVKALCLGAKGVLIGRAYAYGVAAGGEAGVARAIEILRADVVRTLTLLGVESVGALDRSVIEAPW